MSQFSLSWRLERMFPSQASQYYSMLSLWLSPIVIVVFSLLYISFITPTSFGVGLLVCTALIFFLFSLYATIYWLVYAKQFLRVFILWLATIGLQILTQLFSSLESSGLLMIVLFIVSLLVNFPILKHLFREHWDLLFIHILNMGTSILFGITIALSALGILPLLVLGISPLTWFSIIAAFFIFFVACGSYTLYRFYRLCKQGAQGTVSIEHFVTRFCLISSLLYISFLCVFTPLPAVRRWLQSYCDIADSMKA